MVTSERTWPDIGTGLATLRDWRAERLSLARFGPLALLLAGAAFVGTDAGWSAFLIRTLVALLLLMQFRLWDDLVDANRDRSSHPERVLARSEDRRVCAAACLGLLAANASAIQAVSGSTALTGFILLNGGLAAWYVLHSARGVVHLHVVLLKYPVFVVLLGIPAGSHSMLAGAAAIYASLCLFDLLDRGVPGTPRSTLLLAAHGLALVLVACMPKADLFGVLTATAVAALVILAWVGAAGHGLLRKVACHAPFVASFLILVRLFIGGTA